MSNATTRQTTSRGPHFALEPQVAKPATRKRVLLRTKKLKKSYRKGPLEIPVLRGVDFQAREGEITSIIGQSGSGKSTLLHLLGTLDVPDSGEIYFGDQRTDNLSTRQRDLLRNGKFGLIFQFYHLLPELTALENVLTPAMISHGVWKYWLARKKLKARAVELLEMVGLGHRLTHRPREMSGGEMQRTAIARALISRPEVLLADEPTGNLDRKTGDEVLEIIKRLNREQGLTIIMVTHDPLIAQEAHSIVRLDEGQVQRA